MSKATIQNGIILSEEGNRVKFKPQCPKCGTVLGEEQENKPGGSRGHLCPKCQMRYSTVIKWY